MTNRFVELAAVDVSKYIEKKNGLTYLSWAWAVDQLFRLDPDASWEYGDTIACGHDTQLVTCTVTAFGKERRAFLPVMDHRNKPIPNPDAFQINTAMQRCLVKAIALHGLGLYIYAGEDVPRAPDEEKPEPQRPNTAKQVAGDALDALPPEDQNYVRDIAMECMARWEAQHTGASILQYITDLALDTEKTLALWYLLPSDLRAAVKKAKKEEL